MRDSWAITGRQNVLGRDGFRFSLLLAASETRSRCKPLARSPQPQSNRRHASMHSKDDRNHLLFSLVSRQHRRGTRAAYSAGSLARCPHRETLPRGGHRRGPTCFGSWLWRWRRCLDSRPAGWSFRRGSRNRMRSTIDCMRQRSHG